jgi:hypothetical protein
MTAFYVIALLLAALIPAWLVARKQPSHPVESFVTYYVFGLLLLVAAIPVAIWVAKDERKEDAAMSEETVGRVQDHLSRGS